MRRTVGGVLALVMLAGCAGEGDPGADGGDVGSVDEPPTGASPAEDAEVGEVAWRHLGVVEETLPDDVAAMALTDADAVADAWDTYGFDGEPPEVAFDDEVVLLLGRPDDACPDELIELEVVDGELVTEWLVPPGGCNEPLIRWLHAVHVHRGVLAESFSYGPEEPFEGELEPVTLELPPYDGDAPPAPEPPRSMSDDRVDEVFADHPVPRCGPEDRVGGGGEVDGPLSDDPEVAEAQRRRAEHGVPSDEASTREALDSDELVEGWDFPLRPEEQEADQQASERLDEAVQVLQAAGWDVNTDVVPMVDRSDGIRPAVVVGADDEAAVRELLDGELGEGQVEIVVSVPSPAEAAAAQEALVELMGAPDEAGAITSLSGPPGRARIGMVDPTREALDRVAELVEPDHVCVDVELSGVAPDDS